MTDTFTAAPRDVEAAFATVFPHVGSDPHLPMLTVVHAELAGSTLLLAATDRYTLAAYRADLDEWAGKDNEQEPLAPVEVNFYATDLRRLFAFARSQKKAPARWTVTADRLAVELGDGSSLSIRTVDVHFVDFRSICRENGKQPADVAHVLNVAPRQIAKFTASAAALAAGPSDPTPLNFWPGASTLRPIMVTAGARFAGLVMPVRVEGPQVLDLAPVVFPPAKTVAGELTAAGAE